MSTHFSRLGKLLKEARLAAGFSQAEVAKKFRYEQQFISNWERGISSPPMRTLKSIAKLYELSLDEVHQNLLEDCIERIKLDLNQVFKKAK